MYKFKFNGNNLLKVTLKKDAIQKSDYFYPDAFYQEKKYYSEMVSVIKTNANKNNINKEILKIHSKSKIIVLYPLSKEEILLKCIELGIKDYIVLPFNKEFISRFTELMLN